MLRGSQRGKKHGKGRLPYIFINSTCGKEKYILVEYNSYIIDF